MIPQNPDIDSVFFKPRAEVVAMMAIFLFFFYVTPSMATITVDTADELEQAVRDANTGGDTDIRIADGTYTLSQQLYITANGTRIQSLSGNRNGVVLEGTGMTGHVPHIFEVAASDVTLSHMTIGRVANHGVQVHGEMNAERPILRNLRIIDTWEQMVKISYDATNPSSGSDSGVMENCLLEYTSGIGPQWYIGGIDCHNGKNWIVRRNTFINIRSPGDSLAEPAIHFWSDSAGTLVEKNVIVNCDRGIGFGLGDRGHGAGIIRNNTIYHNAVQGFGDVGISLESAPGVKVVHNTVFQQHDYANAIEYRFTVTSGVTIANNLTNKAISARDGASGTLQNNVTWAAATWFKEPAAGNLHLSGPISQVVDQGHWLPEVTDDMDGESRPKGSGFDIGADELAEGVPKLPNQLNFIWMLLSKRSDRNYMESTPVLR